jgi:hypothetical protein
MRPWIVAATVMTALAGSAHFASAQLDRTLSPSPSQECKSGTGGLPAPALGETTGSANLSDQLSRSKGVICPPAGIDPGIATPPAAAGLCQ